MVAKTTNNPGEMNEPCGRERQPVVFAFGYGSVCPHRLWPNPSKSYRQDKDCVIAVFAEAQAMASDQSDETNAEILFRMGECYRGLGNIGRANAVFSNLTGKYPITPWSDSAQKRRAGKPGRSTSSRVSARSRGIAATTESAVRFHNQPGSGFRGSRDSTSGRKCRNLLAHEPCQVFERLSQTAWTRARLVRSLWIRRIASSSKNLVPQARHLK